MARIKSWLGRESANERLIRHLEAENARLIAENTGLLGKLLLKEGYSPIGTTELGSVEAQQPAALEYDDELRERDERAEIEERAIRAATDPDYMEQVLANIEEGDRAWIPILQRATELMEKAN